VPIPIYLWQLKQIVSIDGKRHVDQCTCFGGRGSCRCCTAFMPVGLVLWIALFIILIADLFGYIDDNFSFDEETLVRTVQVLLSGQANQAPRAVGRDWPALSRLYINCS
jgi:hypothetical protein